MNIIQFDAQRGLYRFQGTEVIAEPHAHPILEFAVARKGRFNLFGSEQNLEQQHFAMILPQQIHRFEGNEADIEFILVETSTYSLQCILKTLEVEKEGSGLISLASDLEPKVLEHLEEWAALRLEEQQHDARVLQCLAYIQQHLGDGPLKLADLAQEVALSSSRLSHLFRAQMGYPLQKYIIWERMKKAVNLIRLKGFSLGQAALEAGFYDAAHFSHHFRELFGLNAFSVYGNPTSS